MVAVSETLEVWKIAVYIQKLMYEPVIPII
jgi:hypothetical protein